MFRVENNVPEVYVQESRDFQLFCRLYDLVLQSSRFSIDSMEQISNTQQCNNTLLTLLGSKIGIFEEFQDVPDSVLRLILDAFPYIVKAKGSLRAVQLTANVCSRITGGKVTVQRDFSDSNIIKVAFENPLQYMSVFDALVEYIRPVGCEIRYILGLGRDYSVGEPDFTVGSTATITPWADSEVTLKITEDTYKNTVGFTKVYNKEET